MEYLAKITKQERSKNKQFWRYTFIDVQTNKGDWFINNYRISHIPNLVGRLKLVWDKNNKYKLYQSFEQDLTNLIEEFKEEEADWLEEGLDEKVEKLDELTKRPIKFKHRDYVEFIKGLHEAGVPWKRIAKLEKRTDRTLRYRRERIAKPLQKVGRKRLINRISLYHLIHSIQTGKAKTLREMVDYIFQQTGLRISKSTIHLTLKRIKHSYQVIPYRNPKQKFNLPEVIEFMERINELPSRQILATDESGFPLNLTPKKGWGIKGQKITRFKKHYSPNYSLILLIRNTDKGGIIHWDIVKGAVNTEIFTNFVNNIELPNEEKYYLLIDRLSSHKTKKVGEALEKKNIERKLIVSANPWINPTEEIFHVIKDYIKKCEPKKYEELKTSITKIINILNQQDLRKYFKDCLDFDFIIKNGN